MAKKEKINSFNNDLGPMPTLGEFKVKLEGMLRKSGADFTVEWFLGLIESHQKEDSPCVVTVAGERVWKWPYRVRVVSLLRKFLRSEQSFKNLIIAAREDNVYWRGDEREFFIMVINETEKMRAMDSSKYISEVKAKMGGFTGSRMTI